MDSSGNFYFHRGGGPSYAKPNGRAIARRVVATGFGREHFDEGDINYAGIIVFSRKQSRSLK
jgi:hypothetical protein